MFVHDVVMYYVYVLKSRKSNFVYVGYSTNLKQRFAAHNEGLSQSTRPYRPFELIFYECYRSKIDAKRREKYLKTTKGRTTLRLMLRDSI